MDGGKGMKLRIERTVKVESLSWPSPAERRSDTLGGNRGYCDLGRMGWPAVKKILLDEVAAVARVRASEDPESECELWMDECFDDLSGPQLGFDLGTNALSAALSASRCLPFYSCNGGQFGGFHNDSHPVVAFFCRPYVYPILLAASIQSRTGLAHTHSGGLVVYAGRVQRFLHMAKLLFRERREIRDSWRHSKALDLSTNLPRRVHSVQLELFDK